MSPDPERRYPDGKTPWEEARDSTRALGCALIAGVAALLALAVWAIRAAWPA